MTTYYAQTAVIGGSGGDLFQYCSPTASVINSIFVWSDSNAILALRFQHADGTAYTIGTPRNGDPAQIFFAPGEQITSLSMMETDGTTTGGHRCVGQITIQTNLGQHKTMGPGGTWSYSVGMTSGLLVGVFAHHGDAIDSLSFFAMRPIQSIVVSVPPDQWDNVIGSTTGITPDLVAMDTFTAPPKNPLPWTFNGTRQVSNTSTFTQASATRYGVDVEVSGEFLGIGASTTASWSREATTTQESSATTTFSIGDEISGVVPANNYVVATTVCKHGQIDLPYTSTVTIKFQDSSIVPVSFSEQGVYRNVTYANASTTASDPKPVGSVAATYAIHEAVSAVKATRRGRAPLPLTAVL